MTIYELADFKHNILLKIASNFYCAVGHPNYTIPLHNALRRLRLLALICNDVSKLNAIIERSSKLLRKHSIFKTI